LGPSLAALTQAQTRVDQQMRELILPIKKAVVDAIVPVLSTIADGVAALNKGTEEYGKHHAEVNAFLFAVLPPAFKSFPVLAEAAAFFLNRERKKEARENPNQDFLDALRRGRPRAEEPSRVEARQRLGIPLLEGR
jgi:hypothetical protein